MSDSAYRILTVGRNLTKKHELAKLLLAAGYDVSTVQSAVDLKRNVSGDQEISIAMVDLKDSVLSGYEVMQTLAEYSPETQVIVVSKKHSTREALEAQRRGAFCYFSGHVDHEEFLFLVAKATIVFELTRKNINLQSAISGTPSVEFVANSEGAKKILAQVQRIARVDTTVLLTGETGTGKTTLARVIHNRSNRAAQPFVSLSCASIPRELLEAELFGYERGAFTGAHARKIGCVELADQGTLFLDEIGDLPLELQPKLLTFLQDRQVRRLGATKSSPLDVRIIAATNKDLEELVANKLFREDLLFRVNVVSIKMPSLRQRSGDIEALAENFLGKLAQKHGEKPSKLSREAIRAIEEYSWPGNVRELENVLERASLFCSGRNITRDDLGPLTDTHKLRGSRSEHELPTLAELEREVILQRLELFEGNKQKAAKSLGISLKTIYNKISAFDLH